MIAIQFFFDNSTLIIISRYLMNFFICLFSFIDFINKLYYGGIVFLYYFEQAYFFFILTKMNGGDVD